MHPQTWYNENEEHQDPGKNSEKKIKRLTLIKDSLVTVDFSSTTETRRWYKDMYILLKENSHQCRILIASENIFKEWEQIKQRSNKNWEFTSTDSP